MHACEHQASGLVRLRERGALLPVVSVLSAAGARKWQAVGGALAGELRRAGARLLRVEPTLAAGACRPLFAWDPQRPLRQQVMLTAGEMRLYAPNSAGGDARLVAAAADLRAEIDWLIFIGLHYTREAAALDPATPQHTVVLIDAGDEEAAYALVKAAAGQSGGIAWILAGVGAQRVAHAAARFLGLRVARADAGEEVWHACDARMQTSCNTLSGYPSLSWHVARIVGGGSLEPHIITRYASQ